MSMWREMIAGPNGRASSKRFVLVLGGVCLSLSAVILSVATVWGATNGEGLWAVCTTLAALAGAGYVGGKAAERPTTPEAPDAR